MNFYTVIEIEYDYKNLSIFHFPIDKYSPPAFSAKFEYMLNLKRA